MEEETFEDVMADGPTDYSKHVAFVLFDFDKFDAWLDRLKEAHEREVDALRGETYLDAVSDSVLVKHGLVRLPVDADGVCWTGDETEHYAPNGDSIPALGLLYHHGEWFVTDRDGAYLAKECHHTKPADPHASLADELEAWCDRVDVDGDACDVPRDLAKRIRRLAAKKDE